MINVFQNFSCFESRNLNCLEAKIFEQCLQTIAKQTNICGISIFSEIVFIDKLKKNYYYTHWYSIFQKSKFVLSGGSMLKCISKLFQNEGGILDIDLFAVGVNSREIFQSEINNFLVYFQSKKFCIFIR